MTLIEIIRLFVVLWPIIEKIIGKMPANQRAQAKNEAIAAVTDAAVDLIKTA